MSDPIDLDTNGTAAVALAVLDGMLPWLRGEFRQSRVSKPFSVARALRVLTCLHQ